MLSKFNDMSRLYQTIGCCLIILFIFNACSEDENPLYEQVDLSTLSENEFVLTDSGGEVQIIFRDCQYNVLQSVEKEGDKIEVVKAFNSLMKLACVLRYDTVSLGVLGRGNYQLDYYLIDRNTMLTDSVFLKETRFFSVK